MNDSSDILKEIKRIVLEQYPSAKIYLYDLEFETGELISPMVYAENEWNTKYRITPFYQNVMNEGQLL